MIETIDENKIFTFEYRKYLMDEVSKHSCPLLYVNQIIHNYLKYKYHTNHTNEYILFLLSKWSHLNTIMKLTFFYFANVDDCFLPIAKFYDMINDFFTIYNRRLIDHGTMVGVQAAQSLGESLTQMTLNSFHHTGTKKNIGYGVKRLRELLDGSDAKQIFFSCQDNQSFEKMVELKITDTCNETGILFQPNTEYSSFVCVLRLKDTSFIPICIDKINTLIHSQSKKKRKIQHIMSEDLCIYIYLVKDISLQETQKLLQTLELITLQGIPGAELVDQSTLFLKSKLHSFEPIYSMDPSFCFDHVTTNDLSFLLTTLGIEAVRQYLFNELNRVLRAEGIELNTRHVGLIVDNMTFTGDIFANRYGSLQIEDAVLIKASFQQATTTFGNAASKQITDHLNDVSAQIMTGKIPMVGIGYAHLVSNVVEKQPESTLECFSPEYAPCSPLIEYKDSMETIDDEYEQGQEYIPYDSGNEEEKQDDDNDIVEPDLEF